MDAGALHIEALRLEDDGNYTCQEVLNETHWFPVRLEVASKWDWWGWAWGGGESLWKRSGMWALVTDDFGLGKLEASLGYTDPVSKKKSEGTIAKVVLCPLHTSPLHTSPLHTCSHTCRQTHERP